jgi:hypothetical protein
MSDSTPTIALCCYIVRALVSDRCKQCKTRYACPEFKTKAAVVQFNAMIPPSMLLAPLPIELWHADIAPDTTSQPSRGSSNSTESPVRRLVSTLGLSTDLDADST